MARTKRPTARDAFEDNLADAEKLLEIVRAVKNRRTYRMRRERQERVGEALDVGKKERGDLDWIEGDEVYLVFKPGSQLGRNSFTEPEMRPFLRQAIVAACAAVETFAADRAKERLSGVLDMDPLPPRLRDLPIPLEDWFRIEETYERRRWGIRPIIEAEFERMASGAPSELGKLMSAVDCPNVWPQIDARRKTKKGASADALGQIVERRNKIAHTGDRAGSGRATITLEEVETDLDCVRQIVLAMDDVTKP